MGLFDRMTGAAPTGGNSEARNIENPNTPITGIQLAEILAGGNVSTAGVTVTQERATSTTTFIACVKILAETIGMLPLPVYRVKNRGRERAPEHPIYQLLHNRPNPELSPFLFREMLQGHLALRGNAYAEIETNNAGEIIGLWPLLPHRVQPIRENGEKKYVVQLNSGASVSLRSDQVMHIPAFGYDGIQGYSPLTVLRHALGLAIATEEFGARFFGNGSRPGGVITRPKEAPKWSPDAKSSFKRSWEEAHAGLTNSQRVAILEEGMDWKQIGISPDDSQFLQTRGFQVTEIARFFRIPLHMLGHLERSSFNNIEQQSIDFIQHAVGPWMARWESVINHDLFDEADRGTYYAQFLVTALLRGDSAARSAYYRQRFAMGTYSQNDIRELENEDPIPGGDRYFVPMNMVPSDRLDDWVTAQIAKGAPAPPANGNELDSTDGTPNADTVQPPVDTPALDQEDP
jgi:HK97 family phage portal protein